jgi:hypothetical protein
MAEDRGVKSFRISGRKHGKPFRYGSPNKPVAPALPQQEV